jgi:hypothetical protein
MKRICFNSYFKEKLLDCSKYLTTRSFKKENKVNAGDHVQLWIDSANPQYLKTVVIVTCEIIEIDFKHDVILFPERNVNKWIDLKTIEKNYSFPSGFNSWIEAKKFFESRYGYNNNQMFYLISWFTPEKEIY